MGSVVLESAARRHLMLLSPGIRKVILGIALFGFINSGSAQTDSSRHRVGAVCNDGWRSSATGSGACSHHAGVRCWLYSDGTCTKP
jgi:hypothetical protein